MYSDLHYVGNINPTRYTIASVNSKTWESSYDASIFNKNWIVWYKQSGKHFEIVLDQDAYHKKILMNLGIGIIFAILGFIIWRISFKIK